MKVLMRQKVNRKYFCTGSLKTAFGLRPTRLLRHFVIVDVDLVLLLGFRVGAYLSSCMKICFWHCYVVDLLFFVYANFAFCTKFDFGF